jgi:hypothetical protein
VQATQKTPAQAGVFLWEYFAPMGGHWNQKAVIHHGVSHE